HVWVTTWIYELPFGKGKKWMSNASPALNALLGGWSIQGFNALMSGTPFSISSGSRTAFFGSGTGRNRHGAQHVQRPQLLERRCVHLEEFQVQRKGRCYLPPGSIQCSEPYQLSVVERCHDGRYQNQ